MLTRKYHLHDIVSTTPYPHMPYWQRFKAKDKIIVRAGAIIGFLTGVTRNKDTAHAEAYYIRGVLMRLPLKAKGQWSAHAIFVPTLKLHKEDLQVFYERLKTMPEWHTYERIRRESLRATQDTQRSSDNAVRAEERQPAPDEAIDHRRAPPDRPKHKVAGTYLRRGVRRRLP